MNKWCLGSAVALLSLVASPLSAFAADSERGAAYIEVLPLGVSFAFASSGGVPVDGASYALEVNGGYHFSGRHDGFVVGLAQRFQIANGKSGATFARLGYDIAVPLGRRELTIAPFAFGGAYYAFSGGDPGAFFGLGAELRFFPVARAIDATGKPIIEAPKRVVVAADHIEIREKIQFKTNEAVIESVSDSLLAEVATVIKTNPQLQKIRIEGHASAEGNAAVNEKLSDDRAKAVRDHLVTRGGVPADLLEAKGYGSSRPIAGNDDEVGREKNRRVEFNIVKQAAVVEKLEAGKAAESHSGEGLYIALKPLDLGFATTNPFVTAFTFQLGAGYAF